MTDREKPLEQLPGHTKRTALHPYGQFIEPVTPRWPEDFHGIDFGEYMMAYAPLSLIKKVCEPI